MAKLQRKSAKLFAEDATAAAGGLAQFGSLAAGTPNYSTDPDVIQALQAYKDGWSSAVLGTKSPALEDRNALDYLLSYQQAYIMQRGIPEWLDTETYYQGSFASKSDGSLYVSKVDNNTGHDPELDTTETYWLKFPTPAELGIISPAGMIIMAPLSSLSGYLLCNGQAVSRTTYSKLFTAIGTNFGTGDGSTTFNVPDYRGCFLRGLGGDSSLDMYTKQPMAAPNITGSLKNNKNDFDSASGALSLTGEGSILYFSANGSSRWGNYGTVGLSAANSNSVYGAANEIRPVNFAINFFIKY